MTSTHDWSWQVRPHPLDEATTLIEVFCPRMGGVGCNIAVHQHNNESDLWSLISLMTTAMKDKLESVK